MSAVVDLANLESHLWEAANILRGPVDAADFKTYIFPLLFFKRISDVYGEEFLAALPVFGATQTPPPAKVASAGEPEADAGQRDLFGAPAAPAATAKTEPIRPAPRPEPAAQPVLIPTPPQGNRSQRLSRLLALGRQRTPEAIGELVAALGDEDEQLRWLAALSLQGISGGTVIATLKAFMDQAPSAVAREETEKVLGKLTEPGG